MSYAEQAGHRHFSVGCFNQARELMKRTDRDYLESEVLEHLAHASLWHWRQREDVGARNLVIGYWLLSRVYAQLLEPGKARVYGERCLEMAQGAGLPSFYLGYAWEALARAARGAGEAEEEARCLGEARRECRCIGEPEERVLLERDLAELVG